MAQDYYCILTNAGLAYEAACKANQVPIKLTHFAVGDGNGAAYNPGPEAAALRRETHRQPINSLLQDEANPSWLLAEAMIADDVGGWTIREVGIYTDTGLLYAIGKYPDSVKPVLAQGSGKQFYVRAIFQTSNATSVTLLIDNSIVMASRAFVLEHVQAELAKRDAKNSVLYTTTAAIALSGLGVQAGGDWPTALPAGARILPRHQPDAKDNGIYIAAAGAWARATDADANLEVTPGLLIPVEQGTVHADSLWQLVTDGPITLGVTALQFEMAAGRTGVAGGTYDQVTVNARGQVVGATRAAVSSIAADTTLTAANRGLVLIDAAAGNRTITLPLADAGLGVMDILLRRVDNSGNRLKVQASGANKIKFHTHLNAAGYAFLYLMGAGDWWHLRSDGAGNWWPVGRHDSDALGRPVFETTTMVSPGGWGVFAGSLFNRADWPWLWDHGQQSGMLTTEAARVGMEGGWTSGDGATTFRGPEGRGEFLRIVDVGRGVDPNRIAGSSQLGSVLPVDATGIESPYVANFTSQAVPGGDGPLVAARTGLDYEPNGLSKYPGHAVVWISGTAATTGFAHGVTRPRNIAYPGRIKLI
ncbi:phage tail protein [Pseudomonas anguilliseptica]|uniref:phage tail protein n=1 Tax=Pseudomonas anguilliseptica TaxID=53406 RepID=UPI00325BE15F